MDSRFRLTRDLVRLILVAAILSAPVYLVAEDLDRDHVIRLVTSNGACAAMCVLLLALLRKGQVELTARLLVYGLLALVGVLAWSNGEDVHVNVVNFVLVTVLGTALLGGRELLLIGGVAATEMVLIAWKQAVAIGGEELGEARMESIAQFLPSYAVIVLVLWMTTRHRAVTAAA